ncbi:MAG: zinc-ribbon domain-containing protein [Blastocatellia bacterium]
MHQMNPPEVRWDWIGEGWQMFAEKWQVWVLQGLIMLLLVAIPAVPFYGMMFSMQLDASSGQPPELPALFFPLIFVGALVLFLGMPFLYSGFYKTAFKQLRGEPISVGDLFSGGDIFLRVLGAFIAVILFSMLGALLCILPAFLVGGLLYFTFPLVVERDLSIGEALSASYEATKANWFMFTLFAFVVALLASLGQYACGVGMLVTFPLQFTIAAVAHRDMFGVAGARRFTGSGQPEYPSNYAPQSFPQSPPQYDVPPQPEPTTVICTNCGTMVNRPSRFCSKCGSPVGA